MTHVVTVLVAQVAPERVADLQTAYKAAEAGPFPAGFIESTLMCLADNATHWRIETIWQSHDALAAMRGAGKPRGVQIFEEAGATPALAIYDAVATLRPPS